MLRNWPEALDEIFALSFVPGWGSQIVDRDDSDSSSPKELSSFDVAKMTEADVAAEIAQRITRWRRAHNRPDPTERGPPTDRPAVHQPVASPPAPGQAAAGQPPVAAPGLDLAGARIERALRMAAGEAEGPGAGPTNQPAERRDVHVVGMKPALESHVHDALRRIRAIGVLAWQAQGLLLAIAAAALAAGAIAGWILMPRDQAPSPEVARQVEATPAIAGAAGEPVPTPETPAPRQAAAPPAIASVPDRPASVPETLSPQKAAAPMPAMVKPAWPGTTLTARLKPTVPAAAPAPTKLSPVPPEAAPKESAPQATAPPKADPQRTQSQKTQAQETGDETRRSPDADDLNGMFDRMFSDGL